MPAHHHVHLHNLNLLLPLLPTLCSPPASCLHLTSIAFFPLFTTSLPPSKPFFTSHLARFGPSPLAAQQDPSNSPADSPASPASEHLLATFSDTWDVEAKSDLRGCIVPSSADIPPSTHNYTQSERQIPKTMVSKLRQGFNLAGIVYTLKSVFKERETALPHVTVPDIRWIDWKALKDSGFQGIVFDKDNTLTAPYAQALWPTLISSLEKCKSTFSGRVAILSNSAGLYQYDPDGMEATAVEDMLGIPVIRHELKKPAGSAEDLEKYFGCNASSLVMVGDRHFTDMVYGNKNGLLTVNTKPLTLMGEPFIIKQGRLLEQYFVQQCYQRGLLPPKHELFTQNSNFVKDPAGC